MNYDRDDTYLAISILSTLYVVKKNARIHDGVVSKFILPHGSLERPQSRMALSCVCLERDFSLSLYGDTSKVRLLVQHAPARCLMHD